MDYFILSSKKDKGCPEAISSAILYDKFYTSKDAGKINIGDYPWYKNVYIEDTSFPEGLFLIAKDKLWDFDIRKDSSGYFIVSEDMLTLLQKFSAPISSYAPVMVCSQSSKPISIRNYYVAAFYPVEINEIADERSRYELLGTRTIVKIDRFIIREGFSKHFCVIAHSANCPPICSKDFYEAAIETGVMGVNFIPVEEFRLI